MGTEIKVLFENRSLEKKVGLDEPFYCKEKPYEVLKELFPKFHVQKYNSLDAAISGMARAGYESDLSRIKPGNDLLITGISIKNFEKEGIEITNSVKDYKLNILVKPLPTKEIWINFKGFVEEVLIKKQVIDSGAATQDYNRKVTVSKYGKQKVTEYLDERKNNPDEEREKKLADILDYGKVIFGEDFDLNDLKKISHKIAKGIPTKIEPTNVFYATLRPSGPWPFSRRLKH